jgi:glycosyltransferase involved in cell wall biosynthesis
MRVGLLHQDINRCSGREAVTISMMKCLKKLGFRIFLLCGKKVNKASIVSHFGVNVDIDKEFVFPIWTRKIQTYIEFILPSIAKPVCDVIINPYTSDLLPWVDVTYVHYPKPLLLDPKSRESKFWDYNYKLYLSLERTLSFRLAHKLVLANSFFTAEATRKQFGVNPVVIYPPVDLKKSVNSKSEISKKNLVLTISQFSSGKKLENIPLMAKNINANFVILGSMYDEAYYRRVRRLIKNYDLGDRVTTITNAPFRVKMELLQKAKVYLHTMPFEHFGISIVEGMGAGCIPVVHDSGGPKEYVPREWRYNDVEDAVQKIKEALCSWSPPVAQGMKTIAYQFREERFQNEFSTTLRSYLMEKRSQKLRAT